jgi:hypothetical protein
MAISLRLSGLSFAARAFPPINPPNLPSSTATGFFHSRGLTVYSTSPVAMLTNSFANWFISQGLFIFLPFRPEPNRYHFLI